MIGWTRPIGKLSLAAPCLCGTLAVAGGLQLFVDKAAVGSGENLALQVARLDGGSGLDVDFLVLGSDGQALGAAEGGSVRHTGAGWEYVAPATGRDLRLTLRVFSTGTPGLDDECKITVVGSVPKGGDPREEVLAGMLPFPRVLRQQVVEYLGDPPGANLVGPYAFLDIETKRRAPDGTGRRSEPRADGSHQTPLEVTAMTRLKACPGGMAGPGRPYLLELQPGPGRGGGLVSWLDPYLEPNARLTKCEVGDAPRVELTFRGNVQECHVEDLRWDGIRRRWRSRVWHHPIRVCGLVPLAGVPERPDCVDGQGHQARCRPPLGLAAFLFGSAVFTEQGSNAVRSVDWRNGKVETLCGNSEEPGYVDGAGCDARFRAPGRVAVTNEPVRCAYVVDHGNGCIRKIDLKTRMVTTVQLAGGAFLGDPQGILAEPDGTLVVVDRDDRLVKRIHLDGRVQVLAGNGPRPEDRFTSPTSIARGLAGGRTIYWLLDGHALVSFDQRGAVRRLAGSAETPGFADSLEARAGIPCLNNPMGLACDPNGLESAVVIADTGNQCLRIFHPGNGTLTTLAGNPGTEPLRWGLPRYGLAEWPRGTRDYATLARPMALAYLGDGGLVVGTGDCLGILTCHFAHARGEGVPVIAMQEPEGMPVAGKPWRLTFTVSGGDQPTGPDADLDPPFHFDYDLTCSNAETETPVHGRGRFGEPISIAAPPLAAGENPVRIRVVTPGGCSAATRRTVTAIPQ